MEVDITVVVVEEVQVLLLLEVVEAHHIMLTHKSHQDPLRLVVKQRVVEMLCHYMLHL